jgi:hypothetical protein
LSIFLQWFRLISPLRSTLTTVTYSRY